MSSDSAGLSFDLISEQVYLIVGVDALHPDRLPRPFSTEEQGEPWWVVESSAAEAERTCAYLARHVPARPVGWGYRALPCTVDDLLVLRQEVLPPPVGFIHHLGWGAAQMPPRAGYTRWSQVRRVEDLAHG
jgi:hypothetical protein